MIYPPLDHPAWLVAAFLVGICVGSFLNVVIYRLPIGLSVNDPKRSFCPGCKSPIPMRRNLPLVSWLVLRGKCADCGGRISIRYFLVELLTGLLFTAAWAVMMSRVPAGQFVVADLAILPVWFLIAVMVSITFIDAEHMIIPLELSISGTVAAVLAAVLQPQLTDLAGWQIVAPDWLGGLKFSALGWVLGFFGLWAVVLLGKMAFGKVEWKHEQPVAWRLEDPETDEDPILFHMGEETLPWWDIFFRKSDRLVIDADTLVVDGEETEAGQVVIHGAGVKLPDGREIAIENLKSLEGTAKRAVIPREAMGMGDVHLMGVIGAFLGPFAVFFSLMAGSLLAIVGALLGRIGFGTRLPFGPYLILGALIWFFGGWKVGEWYLAAFR
ncbi:prepilin peptidase [Haloferula sargassicola]|uniref:Prepilin peptidase A24 N-terminal domain-containing protein n=1 Tax=Haloferula sargassicola TaxID=490096 RepID=A0ABP9UID7_9BACT